MKTFGGYLRKSRENKELPLRKVAAVLDIDTSILSKIERNERKANVEMIPLLSDILDIPIKELQIQFIRSVVMSELGDLEFLKVGLKKTLVEL